MNLDSTAFERYRRLPNEKTTLPRLVMGTLVIAFFWLLVTGLLIFGGAFAQRWVGPLIEPDATPASDSFLEGFMGSRIGVLATLLTFAGIWVGAWVAMKLLHRENLSRLYGTGSRIAWPDFGKGLAAVVITSILAEIAIYLMAPEMSAGSIGFGAWLLFLVPVFIGGFVQTSAEELLFRGYLLRGLAYRFRSPLVWAVLPTLAFTALHWNPTAPLAMNIAVFISIGVFASVLVVFVYVTGNLGAAMGAHLGNNIVGFLLISHEDTLSSFSLFRGASLAELEWTALQTVLITAISIAAALLALVLLLHAKSPLQVKPKPDVAAIEPVLTDVPAAPLP